MPAPAVMTLHLFGSSQEAFWITAVWFSAATFVLDLFDISLPRGDSIGVSGALGASSLLILGPLPATIICIGTELLAHIIRRGAQEPRRLATMLVARLAGLIAGTATIGLMGVQGPQWYLYAVAVVVSAVFLLSELVAAQAVTALGTGRPLGRLIRGNLVMQAPLMLAEWSASVLLLITFDGMGSWSLIPVVALLLLMRQSYALLLDIREMYRTTVEVLVEAAEAQDVRRLGHAERTAEISRRIAMRMGLTMSQVELVSYAALLHDVDAIAEEAQPDRDRHSGQSSALFEGVDFFADVLPVLRICDGNSEDVARADDDALTNAMIVALASDADAADHVGVADAHWSPTVDRVAPHVSAAIKARVVASALALGYKTPAVS